MSRPRAGAPRPGARLDRHARYSSPFRRYGLSAAVAMLVASVVLVVGLRQPLIRAWLLGSGASTFLFFAFDKQRARSNGGRAPERVLQGMSLLGGVLGGWAGMLLLHHKTRKRSFWLVQWSATLLWGAVILWRTGVMP